MGFMAGSMAGILGIGGGIFLVPLILVLNLGNVKEAAACGAVFVLLNSMIGLVSRRSRADRTTSDRFWKTSSAMRVWPCCWMPT